DLGGDLDGKLRRIELGDPADPRHAAGQALPEVVDGIADRGDGPEPGHYDTVVVTHACLVPVDPCSSSVTRRGSPLGAARISRSEKYDDHALASHNTARTESRQVAEGGR